MAPFRSVTKTAAHWHQEKDPPHLCALLLVMSVADPRCGSHFYLGALAPLLGGLRRPSLDVPACGRPILPSVPFRALSRPSFAAHVVFQWSSRSAQKVNRPVQQVNRTSRKVDRTTPKVNRTSQKIGSATPQVCVCACVSSSSLSLYIYYHGAGGEVRTQECRRPHLLPYPGAAWLPPNAHSVTASAGDHGRRRTVAAW